MHTIYEYIDGSLYFLSANLHGIYTRYIVVYVVHVKCNIRSMYFIWKRLILASHTFVNVEFVQYYWKSNCVYSYKTLAFYFSYVLPNHMLLMIAEVLPRCVILYYMYFILMRLYTWMVWIIVSKSIQYYVLISRYKESKRIFSRIKK